RLRVGDRIAVAGNIPIFGKTPIDDWEATLLGLMISEGQCCTPSHSPTYTSSDPELVRLLKSAVAASGLGEVTFKGNGTYGYLATGWLESYGLNVKSGDKFVPQRIFMAPRESVRLFLQALFAGDRGLYQSSTGGVFLEYYSKSRRLIEDVHHLLLRFGVFSLIREKWTTIGTRACSILITDRTQIARFAQEIGFVPGCVKQLRLENEVLPSMRGRKPPHTNFDTLPKEAWPLLAMASRRRGTSLNSIGVHPSNQSVPYGALARVATVTADPSLAPLVDGPVW